MTATLIANTSKYAGNGNAGFITDAIDTTGATLLVIARSSNQASAIIPTDSKGNTWQSLTQYSEVGGRSVRIHYCYSPAVGAGHTFTWPVNVENAWPTIHVLAYSGMVDGSGVYDTSSGHADESTQAITPAQSGELILSNFVTTAAGAPAPSAEFTIISALSYLGGTRLGSGVAAINPYNSASPVECIWTPATNYRASAIVAFKIAPTDVNGQATATDATLYNAAASDATIYQAATAEALIYQATAEDTL